MESLYILLQLLFPTADSARPFSMLGLGDIVIPGMLLIKHLLFFFLVFLGFAGVDCNYFDLLKDYALCFNRSFPLLFLLFFNIMKYCQAK